MAQVFWITGLAGAGKSSIGHRLYTHLQQEHNNIVFLDGDTLREVYGDNFGYTKEDRYKVAMCNARLCKLLASQGQIVVCCTISMFDAVRAWNRANIDNYIEIYVKVSREVLYQKKKKNLYSTTNASVAGIDVAVELPQHPDIILENDGVYTLEQLVAQILTYSNSK